LPADQIVNLRKRLTRGGPCESAWSIEGSTPALFNLSTGIQALQGSVDIKAGAEADESAVDDFVRELDASWQNL
jgi:hypothetical protein